MTSPIKPPGGPSGSPSPDGVGGPGRAGQPKETSEAFRQTLDRTSGPEEAPRAAGASAADPVAQVAADLRAGRIDVDTALDRLVERAMSSRAVEALPPARRSELEAHLRRSLADDPTLVALTRDLERGD